MKKKLVLSILLAFLAFVNPTAGFSQIASVTEDELINNAENLFNNNDFKSAMPLYAHLVSVHPGNAIFNYRYGVCTLYGKRDDKETPIKYLTIAEKKGQDNPDLNYYLGLAYNYNQDYVKALKYYNLYLNNAPAGSQKKAEVLKSVNTCLNGLSLSGKKLISEIIDKTTFEKDNFHRGYYADDLNGTLIVKPDIFKTKTDNKKEGLSLIYLSEPQGTCYFSSYGDGETGNRDIYKSVLQENDEWSEPEKLPSAINTQYDEDYPVLTDNGNTLYFCSKGHNSLGGYDIFVTKFDKEKKVWSEPENLGVGVNSPFDDILFIPCKNGNLAYFASDRNNTDNTITVFNVRLNTTESPQELALTEALPQEKNTIIKDTEPVETNGTNYIAQNTIKEEKPSGTKQVSTKSAAFIQRERLLEERNYTRSVTDSAFLFVANTKNDIRKLTNTRERVKRISDSKKREAGIIKSSLDSLMKILDNVSDIEIVKSELEKAKSLKQEYCSLMAASGEAYRMAKELSAHIEVKEKELANLKQFAGLIQSKSVSGDIDSIKILFAEVKFEVNKSEKPVDLSDEIMLISSGEMEFTIPEKELAFAGEYLKQRENGTFLAKADYRGGNINSKNIKVIDKSPTGTKANSGNIKIVTPAVVETISIAGLTLANTEPADEDIEIWFINDVTPVHTISTEAIAMSESEPVLDDNIEINFDIDAKPSIPVEEIIVEKQAIAVNSSVPGSADFNFNPATEAQTGSTNSTFVKNDGLTYLTNSFVIPEEIETSKTDTKLLELAFSDPSELTYEELLFAAQLAANPSKSLEILDYAFVNTGRDWRAYNNAAAYAIELKDYNRAKVYLKQALMITDDNGMIENNIGILAYHIGDYESAEKHFTAAANFGENSKHNLMVLQYAIDQTGRDSDKKVDTAVEPDELIGDIIDYFPTAE